VRFAASGTVEERHLRAMGQDAAVMLAASLPYLLARAMAWAQGDPDSATYVQSHWQTAGTVAPARYLLGLWSGYRAAWVFVAAAVVLWMRRVGRGGGAVFAVAVCGAAV